MYSINYTPQNVTMDAYTKEAHSLPCIKCGALPAMPCHYTGPRQIHYGKGTGIKCSDLMIADLCLQCHEHFDQYRTMKSADEQSYEFKKMDHSEQFLHYVLMTIHRRLELGLELKFPTDVIDKCPI